MVAGADLRLERYGPRCRLPLRDKLRISLRIHHVKTFWYSKCFHVVPDGGVAPPEARLMGPAEYSFSLVGSSTLLAIVIADMAGLEPAIPPFWGRRSPLAFMLQCA